MYACMSLYIDVCMYVFIYRCMHVCLYISHMEIIDSIGPFFHPGTDRCLKEWSNCETMVKLWKNGQIVKQWSNCGRMVKLWKNGQIV